MPSHKDKASAKKAKPRKAWAIKNPWSRILVVFYVSRTAKEAWEKLEYSTRSTKEELKRSGYRAVRVLISPL